MFKDLRGFIRGAQDSAGAARGRINHFAKAEDGALVVLVVFLLVIMLALGGIGVDVMRFERDRSKLQAALDRAVLAAADLDQPLCPREVVEDYLTKDGLESYLTGVTVTPDNCGEENVTPLGFRIVEATAESTFATQLMHLSGVDSMTARASSIAEESIGKVEISLILDVSGSMNSYNRLPNLKVAAKDFIDQMVETTRDGDLSISIVPYATQVSVPSNIFDEYTTTGTNNYSRCINFAAGDFSSASIDQTQAYQRTLHFDPWYTTDRRDNGQYLGQSSYTNSYYGLPVCEAWSNREILPLQSDATTIKNYIDNLVARGNTSLDIGMKWGTAMLAPEFRPVTQALIDDGTVQGNFGTRPANFNDGETLKVIVLMTDGNNTSQYYIKDDYREGMSNIWWNEEEEVYSVYNPDTGNYFWPNADDVGADGVNDWQDHPFGNGTEQRDCGYYSCWDENNAEPGTSVRLDFPELWARTSLWWNVKYNYYPWMNDSSARSEWVYGVRSYVNDNTKDARTRAICDAAKDQNVILYTIGFEAPEEGLSVLRYCASSDSHFYDVDGLEISDAFASIGSSIRKLRLTQ